MSDTEHKNKAETYQQIAKEHYDEISKLKKNHAPLEKIENYEGVASKFFRYALVLGEEKAAFWLFKCFLQGVGVKQNDYIATLMYGVAQELTPQELIDCDTKIPDRKKPKASELRVIQPRIDELVKLIKDAKTELPKEGVNEEVFVTQIDKFDKGIKLPSGQILSNYFTKANIPEKVPKNMLSCTDIVHTIRDDLLKHISSTHHQSGSIKTPPLKKKGCIIR